MAMQILQRPIFQYAWFVDDVVEASKRWHKTFGAGPFFIVPHHHVSGADPKDYWRYRGTDVQSDVSYAFGYCGPVQIQFIQQHDDKASIYTEMYQPGKFGFHHVGIYSEDFKRDRAHLDALGMKPALELWGGADVVYYDGMDLVGCFVEIHDRSELIDNVFANWKTAHDTWDGKSDPIRMP